MRFPLRPSTRGWYFIASALIWYLIARINQNFLALVLSWSSLALLGISLLMVLCSFRKLRISRLATPDAQVGKLLNLPLRVHNPSWLPSSGRILMEKLPFAATPDLGLVCPPLKAHATPILTRSVMPVKRGEFHLQEILSRSTDPAGLFLRERHLKLPDTVIVYPHTFSIDHLYLTPQESFNASTNETPVAAAGNSQDFYSVREYHPSDGMKYIHWKSSAKRGKFMVREFQRATALTVLILVDADEAHLTPKTGANLETAVSLAASVCKFLGAINCSLAFAAGGDHIQCLAPQESHVAVANVMYQLATLKPGKATLAQALDAIYPSLPEHTAMFCFSLHDSEEIQHALELLNQRNDQLRWYLTAPEDFMPLKRKKCKSSTADAQTRLSPLRITPDMSPDDIFPN